MPNKTLVILVLILIISCCYCNITAETPWHDVDSDNDPWAGWYRVEVSGIASDGVNTYSGTCERKTLKDGTVLERNCQVATTLLHRIHVTTYKNEEEANARHKH